MTSWMLWCMVAYAVGSIPCGVLLGRLHGIDVRQEGSRNIGATNVGRLLGRRYGIACFLLDLSKGGLPVLLAGQWHGILGADASSIPVEAMTGWLLVAIAAVAGHMFSAFLRFGGGKGVATTAGALLGIYPALTIPVAISLAIWTLVVLASRLISLASIVAAITLPVATFLLTTLQEHPSDAQGNGTGGLVVIVAGILGALIIARHHANLRRIINGTEPRLGNRPSEDSDNKPGRSA